MKYCLVVCLLLAGCAKPRYPDVVPVVPDTQKFSPNGFGLVSVFPITMHDGTKCVAATLSSTGVSITCDWSKSK